MLAHWIPLALSASCALGCGRIGFELSLENSEGRDGGGTPPDATLNDAARTDDGSLVSLPDAGTGMVTNLLVVKSGEPDWNVLSGPELGGAYATLTYFQSGPTFRFRLDAQGLPPSSPYVLVQFNDPWPGVPAEDIAAVMSNDAGSITLDWTEYDFGRDLIGGEPKIWLVTDGHVDTANNQFTTWSPTEYLFEIDFLTFDDTDI